MEPLRVTICLSCRNNHTTFELQALTYCTNLITRYFFFFLNKHAQTVLVFIKQEGKVTRGVSNDQTRIWGSRCSGPARAWRPRRIHHQACAAIADMPMLPTRRMVLGTLRWNKMVDGRGRLPWTFSLYHAASASASTAAAAATGEVVASASSPLLTALDPCRATSLSRGTNPAIDSCHTMAAGHELAVAAGHELAVATPPLPPPVLRGEAGS
jgi:hypothetical protein